MCLCSSQSKWWLLASISTNKQKGKWGAQLDPKSWTGACLPPLVNPFWKCPHRQHLVVCLDNTLNMVRLTIQINYYKSRPPDPCLGYQSLSPIKILLIPQEKYLTLKCLNHWGIVPTPAFIVLKKHVYLVQKRQGKYDFLNLFCTWLSLFPLVCHAVTVQWNLSRCQLHGVCTLQPLKLCQTLFVYKLPTLRYFVITTENEQREWTN